MRRLTLLTHGILLLSLTGCDEKVDTGFEGYACGEGTHVDDGECVPDSGLSDCHRDTDGPECEDLDGDGWPRSDGDCDDADPNANPGEQEVCDGVDNDCDGYVDNNASDGSDWYPDADGDGYGDPEDKYVNSCSAPSNHVADATDCDDTDATINPEAEDTWYDGLDSDCSGNNDYDQDGDGYDSSDYDGDDCDDNSTEVGPHMEEVCDDGLDNDCDGSNNGCGIEGEVSLTDGQGVFYGVVTGDYAGAAVAGAGDVNGDGYDDALVAAPRADTTDTNAGDAYLIYGPISGSFTLDAADVILSGAVASDLAGSAMAGLGDVSSDGYDDILISAYGDDTAASGAGAVYLLQGPVTTGTLGEGAATLLGAAESDNFGYSLASAGDTDADSFSDIIVGAYAEDSGGSNAGAAYVFTGVVTGSVTAGEAMASFTGSAEGDNAGWSVAGGGDVNGDGIADMLVGAPGSDNTGTDAGIAVLFHGTPSGTASLTAGDAILSGVADGDYAGYSVAIAGDVNADGFADVLVGAYGSDEGDSAAGAAYILWGPVAGSKSLGDAETIILGDSASGRLGISVAPAGDINSDGQADVLIGADRYYGGLGAAYLVLGYAMGTIDATDSDAMLEGQTYYDWAGASVAGAGDTNADGMGDLLVGAWGNDTTDSDAGAAYLFEGHGI